MKLPVDYRLTVFSDCCADGDEDLRRVLTTRIFTRQADMISRRADAACITKKKLRIITAPFRTPGVTKAYSSFNRQNNLC